MLPPLPVLFAYPLFAIFLFSKLPKRHAIIWTVLIGYLFLPPQVGYNLPVLPRLNKESILPLCVLLCLGLFRSKPLLGPQAQPGLLPKQPVVLICVIVLLAGGIFTALTNTDRLVFGELALPRLRLYDGFSAAQNALILVLPMLIARKFLADEESHKLLLKALAIAGAVYSVPIVFELIMSPQLNQIVYGFFPTSWKQHLRGDGYRPIVFLKHGLWLGVFTCCALLATLAYMRATEAKKRFFYILLGGWLLLILMASKVIGSFGTAVLLVPVVLFLSVRLQLLAAAMIAITLLTYPVLRSTDTIPVYQFADVVERYDATRASSFRYRLFNEDDLLERANERPLFGWGGWNRARIFDEEGRDQTTTDGFWIILIGERGWVGYFALMGLLTAPVLILLWRKKVSLATAGLCLVLASNLINLIPNAALTVVTWLIAGALAGRLERQAVEDKTEDAAVPSLQNTAPGYSRFGPRDTQTKTTAPPAKPLGANALIRKGRPYAP